MTQKHLTLLTIALALIVALTACGGQPEPTATPTATPTPFPTFAFVQPTEAPAVATAGAATATAAASGEGVALNPTAVARGADRYTALECASCHGEMGEGVEGEGPALVPFELDEEAFIDYMRTGGPLGNDHLYSTDRLSDSGGRNLYQYLLSLNAE